MPGVRGGIYAQLANDKGRLVYVDVNSAGVNTSIMQIRLGYNDELQGPAGATYSITYFSSIILIEAISPTSAIYSAEMEEAKAF